MQPFNILGRVATTDANGIIATAPRGPNSLPLTTTYSDRFIRRWLFTQTVACLVISVACLLLLNRAMCWSMVVGWCIFCLPSLLFAAALGFGRPRRSLGFSRLICGMILKWLLTAIMFAVAIKCGQVDVLVMMVAFMGSMLVHGACLLIVTNRKKLR